MTPCSLPPLCHQTLTRTLTRRSPPTYAEYAGRVSANFHGDVTNLWRGETRMWVNLQRSASWLNRWVPTCGDPGATNDYRDCVVQLQGFNRCASSGRAPDDTHAIRTPEEVSNPALATWVEQANPPPGQRIGAIELYPLVAIAEAAGKPEVVFVVRTTECRWDDVFDFQWTEDQRLVAATVTATVPCLDTHTSADRGWNIPSHGASGGRRPRRTASARPWAFRTNPRR